MQVIHIWNKYCSNT